MRKFNTGATRDDDEDKVDYEGCLSPIVLQAFAEYMNKHATMADGSKRTSDNWQKGFGEDNLYVCIKSKHRHDADLWLAHRGFDHRGTIDDAICGIFFNLQAYYHDILLRRIEDKQEKENWLESQEDYFAKEDLETDGWLYTTSEELLQPMMEEDEPLEDWDGYHKEDKPKNKSRMMSIDEYLNL